MSRASAHVEIRPYQPADQAGFAQLVAAVLIEYGLSVDPNLEADLAHPEISYQGVWVAIDKGRVIGSVAIRLLDDGKSAELKRMYLQPEQRGRGLGRTLLNNAVQWARDHGCQAVVLDTSTAMTGAQRFYESAGFSRTGTRTEAGEHGARCEVLYKLVLA
jgi:GNAT superfamily N-acetyltransferase